MRLDYNLIYKILTIIEEHQIEFIELDAKEFLLPHLSSEEYDAGTVVYHVMLLDDLGYIAGRITNSTKRGKHIRDLVYEKNYIIERITFSGHEFLNALERKKNLEMEREVAASCRRDFESKTPPE